MLKNCRPKQLVTYDVITPTFVNTHTHFSSDILAKIKPIQSLPDKTTKSWWLKLREEETSSLSEEIVKKNLKDILSSYTNSGVTAFNDISIFSDIIKRELSKNGFHGIFKETYYAGKSLLKGKSNEDYAPIAAGAFDLQVFKRRELKNDDHSIFHIHWGEDEFGHDTNLPPPEEDLWLEYFKNKKNLIFAHGIYMNWNFLKSIEGPQKYISINLSSNSFFHKDFPKIEKLHKLGFKITIGSDSLLTRKNNFIDELKFVKEKYPNLNDNQILKMATINGAKALNLQDKIGKISIGYLPSFNVFNNISPNNFIQSITEEKLVKVYHLGENIK